ncbi:hypothetical protein [Marinicella marina]|uniref:hypothetical protein n=1 Tax=Marinicella marina TaxID=2996016 RepID=UPI002260B9FF|nr:hypothetical protein [Marinicella marina]MDJ1138659.1 hypothetical protein [Marinicella marina]
MKNIYFLLLTTILTGFSLPSSAVEKDYGFCYSCTESDKQRVARSKIGYHNNKHVTVVNRYTRQATTYNVYKIVEPGLFQVLTSRMNTSQQAQNFVNDAFEIIDAINSTQEGIPVNLLPGSGSAGFPNTVHDLVGNFNGQQRVLRALQDYVTSQSGVRFTTWTNKVAKFLDESGNLDSKEWTVFFNDSSSVTFDFSGTTQDGTTGSFKIKVKQSPNSMVDSDGNTLPDIGLSGFPGNTFTVTGGGGGGNIVSWLSMISRLRIQADLENDSGNFTLHCYWTSNNTVQCDPL